jgi:gluconate 2-dehydrogenase gamma chain
MNDAPRPRRPMITLTRRDLLLGTGGIAITGGLAGCQSPIAGEQRMPTMTPVPLAEFDPAPPSPLTPVTEGPLAFFTEEEAGTLEALLATILPGSPDDPGAREAGVLTYIDNLLAEFPDGFAEPIYRMGPWARPYDGDTPPGENTDEIIWVKRDQLPRYGFQSPLTPHEMYRRGLALVAAHADAEYGMPVSELDEEQLQELVGALADGELNLPDGAVDESEDGAELAAEDNGDEGEDEGDNGDEGNGEQDSDQEGGAQEDEEEADSGYADPSLDAFFDTMRQHLIEGMFGDPAYGGNREMAGWRLVGYPGAQRSYTPRDFRTPGVSERREPQALADLTPFNPGVRVPVVGEENVVLPVSGSEPWTGETGFDREE